MYNLRSGFRKYFCLAFLIALIFLSVVFSASAAEVTIAWDVNLESDIAGYKLYYGTSSRNYTVSLDAGNTTNYTITSLEEGTTYHFAATAYDTALNESAYSTELVHTISVPNRAPEIPSQPSGAMNGYLNTNYSFSTTTTDIDGDPLQYKFDWGNGVISIWGSVSQTFSWSSPGNYCVKAQAKDDKDAISEWSACQYVNISEQSYTIAATTGANGSIFPLGIVEVTHGSSQAFAISAAKNYHVQEVLVDGASVGAVSSYAFNKVTKNHTIQASFAIDIHTITSSVTEGGNIFPAGSILVNHGSDQTYTIAPNENYQIADVLVGGTSVGPVTTYMFSGVYEDHTINAIFASDNQPPIANAGANQTVWKNDTVQLDGRSSSDADGDILAYQWSFTSKPDGSNSTLLNASAENPSFLVDVAGTYIVQLIVADGTTISQPDTVVITTENSPPIADAGPDQTVGNGKTVALNGANSTVNGGGIASYRWVQISGPSVSLSDPGSIELKFLAPEVYSEGTSLVFELTVTDADGLTNTDSCIVNVTWQNEPPTADAGGDMVVLPGQSVVLDGSGSHDIDDDIVFYNWTQIEGKPVTISDPKSPTPDFTASDVGPEGESYTFELTVSDHGNLKDTDTCIVNVTWQNQSPSAVTNDYMETTEGLRIELEGYLSTDSDGEIVKYRWRQVEGPPVTVDDPEAPQAIFNAPSTEQYGNNLIFTLKVTDKGGLKSSARSSVFVFPKDSAPVTADDIYSTAEGIQLNVSVPGVLANDFDVNGDEILSQLVSGPGNGSLTLNADGSFTYTPDTNFVGFDSFKYFANDGRLDSNISTVSVTVNESDPIIYVSDLIVDLYKKGAFYQAGAHVIIKDDSGKIVKGASVTGVWMKNGSIINEVSGTTNGVGEAKLYSNKVKASSMDQLAIEISNVLKKGYVYEPNTNIISDAVVEIP